MFYAGIPFIEFYSIRDRNYEEAINHQRVGAKELLVAMMIQTICMIWGVMVEMVDKEKSSWSGTTICTRRL